MDIKDSILNVCNELVRTNGSLLELGRSTKRDFARQGRINKYLIGAVIGYMIISELKRKEQNAKIKELSEKIEELADSKGE